MFETERCMINSLQKTDFHDIKRLYINHQMRKFLGGICCDDSIQGAYEEMLHPQDSAFYWVVREKQTDDFIGLVSLAPHHDGDFLEISYQLLPDWWGKGYATEIVQQIIHFAFNELNLPKVVAETQIANSASRKLLEKLGMALENTTRRFGADQAIYAIQKY